jgi:transposase-like protein
MKGHGSKFGRKKEEAIAALLTQRNIEEAAKSIGIAPNTLLSWMRQPEFLTAYREARRDAYRQAIARLQQGTSAGPDHAAEDADRCEHADLGQGAGGGSHLQSRGEGD